MAIDVTGIPTARPLRGEIVERLGRALKRVSATPVSARVAFSDENGPKGGNDTRCAITVDVPYQPPIHVENLAETAESAFLGSVQVVERQIDEYRERQRERRRRPKKYYVAKRLL